MVYKYYIRLRLNETTTEVPVKIKGEEVERTMKCFNVMASIYDIPNGALIRELTEKDIMVVEVKGIVKILPGSLHNVRVLSLMVEKGIVERKGNILKIY